MNAVFSESVRVSQHGSSFAFERKLLISTGKIDRDIVLLRVGAAGYANKSAELEVGEFIFFERASDEIYEVRVINIQAEFRPYIATYLVSRVNPSQIFGNISRLNDRVLWNSKDAVEQQFSDSERDYLKAKLSLFEKRISEDFSNSKELRDFVHEKIDYLSQALERQTKMD